MQSEMEFIPVLEVAQRGTLQTSGALAAGYVVHTVVLEIASGIKHYKDGKEKTRFEQGIYLDEENAKHIKLRYLI
jgi:hypothetical protein